MAYRKKANLNRSVEILLYKGLGQGLKDDKGPLDQLDSLKSAFCSVGDKLC